MPKLIKKYLSLILYFVFISNLIFAEASQVKFAAIGDYGVNSIKEGAVAKLVKSWNPDFIITLGDNNYPSGESSTIDENIGKYYSEYILNYKGKFLTNPSNRKTFLESNF